MVVIHKDCGLEQQVYNSPTASQVAAIWVEGNKLEGRYPSGMILHSKIRTYVHSAIIFFWLL